MQPTEDCGATFSVGMALRR